MSRRDISHIACAGDKRDSLGSLAPFPKGCSPDTVYEKMIREGASQEVIDEFARISPIAWIHILFAGRYSFKKSTGNIDVAEMAKTVEIHLRQHFWKAA